MKQLSLIFQPFGRVNKVYFLFICVFWIFAGMALWMLAPQLIPTPMEVGSKLVELLTSKDFYVDVFTSIGLTCKAMLISIVVASILAYLSTTGFFRPIAMFLVKLRYMSMIGLVFTFVILLKGGNEVKISMLMFGIIPFFVLSLLSTIDKVEQKEYDLCQTLKYSPWQMLYELVIFGRMDYTIETIRANFAMAWLMITMVESFSQAQGGIGVELFAANKYNNMDKIFALQIIILLLGILFDYVLVKMRQGLFPYVRYAELKK